jgi:hypothetical protein
MDWCWEHPEIFFSSATVVLGLVFAKLALPAKDPVPVRQKSGEKR